MQCVTVRDVLDSPLQRAFGRDSGRQGAPGRWSWRQTVAEAGWPPGPGGVLGNILRPHSCLDPEPGVGSTAQRTAKLRKEWAGDRAPVGFSSLGAVGGPAAQARRLLEESLGDPASGRVAGPGPRGCSLPWLASCPAGVRRGPWAPCPPPCHPWAPTRAQPCGTLRLGRVASWAWLPTLGGGPLPSRPCFGVAPAPEGSL